MYFVTHTGLEIHWRQEKGLHLVTLKGDAGEKVLYRGDNLGLARKTYTETQAHYQKRAEVEHGN